MRSQAWGLLASVTLGGCTLFTGQTTLASTAPVERVTAGCRITLSGEFPAVNTLFPGAHQQYEGKAALYVPGLKGTYDASDIQVFNIGPRGLEDWPIQYLKGTVVFVGPDMTVSFTQHLPGRAESHFRFNGTYELANRQTCA